MKALLVLLAISAHGAALAADADLLRCRTINDPLARVKCYDGIAVAGATASATPAGAAVLAIPTAPVAKAAAPAPAADPVAAFGLSTVRASKTAEPNAIESTITGKISGWGSNTRFQLANGQVWRVADGSSGTLDDLVNPRVTLKRNMIGTIFLEFEGSNHSPRVLRVQ